MGVSAERRVHSHGRLRSVEEAMVRAAFEKDTTAVISTNSDLGRMLKSMAEATTVKPAR
jgi:hypothetical protein